MHSLVKLFVALGPIKFLYNLPYVAAYRLSMWNQRRKL